jgi:hypothetical protein
VVEFRIRWLFEILADAQVGAQLSGPIVPDGLFLARRIPIFAEEPEEHFPESLLVAVGVVVRQA